METTKNTELDGLFKRQEELDRQRSQRAEELKTKMEELAEKIADGATEEITQLRTTLGVAKEKLMEQNTLLQRLTASPLVLAFVLRVDAGEPIQDSLAVGRKVRILPDAPSSSHHGEIGTVHRPVRDHGEITIKFSDGDTEQHMVNLLPMGLEDPRQTRR